MAGPRDRLREVLGCRLASGLHLAFTPSSEALFASDKSSLPAGALQELLDTPIERGMDMRMSPRFPGIAADHPCSEGDLYVALSGWRGRGWKK